MMPQFSASKHLTKVISFGVTMVIMQRDTSSHPLDAACETATGYASTKNVLMNVKKILISKREQSVASDTHDDVTMPRHRPNNETALQPCT